MKLRVWRGLFELLLLMMISAVLAACGDDDAALPPGIDGGGADAGPRDAGRDALVLDAMACADDDGDGHGAAPCDDDCDDSDASRYPGATEVCDGDDEDCNDTTLGADADADGFASSACCNGAGNCGPDCDDALSTVSPTGAEVCDGLDDDCDGSIDEAVCVDECALGTPCGAGLGTCTDTFTGYTCTCTAGYAVSAVGGPCADIDECALDVDDCTDAPDACVNSAGAFTCTCPPTFIGTARGAAGCTAHFTDLGGGTVRDNATTRVWQAGSSPAMQGQAASVTYCAGLTLAGGGWRLPTITELSALADVRLSPALDATFFTGTAWALWSASPSAAGTGWGFEVATAAVDGTILITTPLSARCVR